MKKTIMTLLAVLMLAVGANATTNTVATNGTAALTLTDTNTAKAMPWELTLGGAGETNPKDGKTSYDFAVSLSIQPFKAPIWFGISQELGWAPSLNGATDIDALYTFPVFKKLFNEKLYLDIGWSGGATYSRRSVAWRTGPEIELEYYTSGNAFLFLGANYDVFTHTAAGGWQTAKSNPFRFEFGFGILSW